MGHCFHQGLLWGGVELKSAGFSMMRSHTKHYISESVGFSVLAHGQTAPYLFCSNSDHKNYSADP
jgi:hypothetical protein